MTGEELLVCVGDVSMGTEEDHVSSGTPGEEIRDSGLREPHEALGELPATLGSNFNCICTGSMCWCAKPDASREGEYEIPSVGKPSMGKPTLMGNG